MSKQSFFRFVMYASLCVVLVMSLGLMTGCKGSDGANGAPGLNGANGSNGTNGGNTVNINTLSADDMLTFTMTGSVTNVSMSAQPVVNFTVTDSIGRGVTGLGTPSASNAANTNYVKLTIATLGSDPTDSTNAWRTYFTDASSNPTNTGLVANLVDNGDGTYQYTFANSNITFDPNATHRLAIQVSGTVPRSSPSIVIGNPLNIIYDFVPSGAPITNTRDIVSETACNGCHTRIGETNNFFNRSLNMAGHGGRMTTKYCVVCHTPQMETNHPVSTADGGGNLTNYDGNTTYPGGSTWLLSNGTNTYAQMEFVTMIHKTHRGEDLALQNYVINNHYAPNEFTYPQDRRNCTTCHVGTNGDNWKTKPTMKACGSCHDNVSWANAVPTGFVQHGGGGGYNDDSQCAMCHTASAIATVHIPFDSPDTNATWNGGTNANTNAAFIAAAPFGTNLPPGALAPTYTINSVTVSSVTATQSQVAVSFTMKLGGNPVSFNTDTVGSPMISGFIGSPSIVVAYTLPQDGVNSPADFTNTNTYYLQNIWLGTQGTLVSGGSGSYTAVLTKTSAGKNGYIPANATMVTAYMTPAYSLGKTTASSYSTNATYTWGTPPLTQVNVPPITYFGITVADFSWSPTTGLGGLIVPAPVASKTAKNYTGRRKIVDNTKCNVCHAPLGVEPTFHAGQRNNGEVCNICHTPDKASNSGWSVASGHFIHAIHSAVFRSNPFMYDAASPTDSFGNVTYPAILNNCQACHVSGMYDFSNSASSSALPNMLLYTAVTGIVSSGTATSYQAAPLAYGVQYDHDYGAAPAATDIATGQSYTGGGTNLVMTPITGACSGCHDKAADIDHMTQTGGGVFYGARSAALGAAEQCLICHGKGGVADINTVHQY